MKKIDLTGRVFGNLSVEIEALKKEYPNGNSQIQWLCQCVCGKKVIVTASYLLAGNKTSCGCMNFKGVHGNTKASAQDISWKALHNRYLQSAKTRKITFSLSEEQVKLICTQHCTYCGVVPMSTYSVYASKNGKLRTRNAGRCQEAWIKHGTIDRLDSNEGYVAANVVPSCLTCNYAKNASSCDEFYDWIRRISSKWAQSELFAFQTHIVNTNRLLFHPVIS